MAHAFVTGGVSSDSERDISVGGVSAVPPSVFDGADYVALGHLHGAQAVTERVRYSGSPYAMSFGEHAHTKGSWLVEVDESGLVSSELVAAPVDRPLRVLRGDLDDLLADPALTGAEARILPGDAHRPGTPAGGHGPAAAALPAHARARVRAAGWSGVDQLVCGGARSPVRRPRRVLRLPRSRPRRVPGVDRGAGLFAEAVEASRVERAARLDELGAMLPGWATSCSRPRTGVA